MIFALGKNIYLNYRRFLVNSVPSDLQTYHQLNNAELPLQKQSDTNNLIQYLPDEVGDGHTLIVPLHEDFSFIDTNYLPNKNLAIVSKIDDQEPRLVVTIALKGQSSFKGYQNQTIFFKEGYTTIAIFKSSHGERQYKANKQIRQLRFSVKKSWLDKQSGAEKSAEIFAKDGICLVSHRPISTQGLIAARHLVDAKDKEALQHLFIQGHAMTLLAAELATLFQEDPQCVDGFTKKDKVTAQMARDILYSEFKNPPSVADLALRVGTNQFKLKKLFHHFFSNTPYGLLGEYRMQVAYQLLETKQHPVNVVADKVGFAHASNFTLAFIKCYGVSPKVVGK